jgi:hypothetical protein
MGQQTFTLAIEHVHAGPNNPRKLCLNGPKKPNCLVHNEGDYLTNYSYFYSQVGQFASAWLLLSSTFTPSLL